MSGKILVVDDTLSGRAVFQRLLTAFGLQPLFAGDGREALEIFGRTPDIALILMDIRLPDMTGMEAATAIREQGLHGRMVPIIAITAAEGPMVRTKCLSVGMNECLHKPIDPRRLMDLIRTLIPAAMRPGLPA